ncbi:MAG: N-acetyl sugar amidotransferase, partial [Afipia sp.]|nr:N-acetyl sugar amidotransferase [Afipia sp.]
DNLSLEIRNGRISRDEAIAVVRARGNETPVADIEKLCSFLGIGVTRFFEISEGFRNHEIWFEESGTWKIRDFLIPEWEWI